MVDYEIYTIGWICAIRAELVAAQELLDEELMEPVPTPENDNNNYTLGKIGEHHVVIAGLPRGQYGVTSAANAARDMVRTFPNIRIGFMVGIGGGIPTHHDIRLGDVVIGAPAYCSGGLIQYDFGKTIQDKGINLMGSLNQPPISVLTAITKLSAYHVRKGHNLTQSVEDVLSKNPNLVDEGFQRPHDNTDKLYESTFIHPRAGAKCSDVCPDSNLKPRDPRTKGQGKPKIHYGLIASNNQLIEDAITRDELAESEHVLCFEMEAAGLANHFPCVVIRGICDYSDSHRGREWQGYAALVAATYAKQLLLQIPPQKIKEEKRMKDILMDELDKRFEPVIRTKEIVETLDIRGKREDDLKILDWLNTVDYSSEQHGFLQPDQRQPGTGQQFLSSGSFQTWMKTKNSLLFCSGMPGAGKTITTAMAIEYLQSKFKDDHTVGLAYIYCSYQKRDQQKPRDLFTSLLKQLALHQLCLPKAIHELYEKNHNGRDRPKFEDIVESLCETIDSFSTTFIIIDALDEHDSWDTFLNNIITLRKRTTANIFLTSRPKPSLSSKLGEVFIHDIQAHDQDVNLYIDQRISQMMVLSEQNTELTKGVKDEFRKLIRYKLSKAVNGVFLLARIYLDNLREETTLRGISVFLENLPTGLGAYSDAYEKTIRRIRNQGQKHRCLALKALSWLTFAIRPLSKQEFRHALSVENEMLELRDEDLQSTNIILHVCMDLVKIDEWQSNVSLLHFTTMEYLKANPNCLLSLESPNDTGFIQNPSDSESERTAAREYYEMKIARTCVTYLLFKDFNSGQCEDSMGRPQYAPFRIDRKSHAPNEARLSALETRLAQHPLYYYAATNWAYHARQGRPFNKVFDFLKSEPHTSASSQCLSLEFSFRRSPSRRPQRLGHVTGLHLTAFFGLKREAASLLSSGMEPDVKDQCNQTPLLYASALGHADVVDELLNYEVDPEAKSVWKRPGLPRTALSLAAKNGHVGVVKLLLKKGGARPDAKPSLVESHLERTPLSFASEAGHQDVVNILVGLQGVDLNCKDDHSRTPLHFAALAGYKSIINSLLATEGVNPNSRDDAGQSPLNIVAKSRDEAVVKLFLAKDGVDPDCRDKLGRAPLHIAVLAGDYAISKLLIATKMVDPDSSDGQGMTPLARAAQTGSEAIVTLLLATNRVQPDVGEYRLPSLFPSIFRQQNKPQQAQSLDEIIKAMVVNGRVNTNSKDTRGWTPLFHAAVGCYKSIVKLLLSQTGVEPNAQDLQGRTVVSHAVSRGHGILELLLSYQAIQPDLEDRTGRTPLSYAAECRDTLAVEVLLNNPGVNPNRMDTSGRTPVFYAASIGGLEVLKLFLSDARVKVDSQDTCGRTVLSYLAERTQVLLESLVWRKNDNRLRKYPILYGLEADIVELDELRRLMRELLVDRDADLFSWDRRGLTPADLMPELLSYERKRPLEQRRKEGKAIAK
ncbi:hypothetical protein FPOAC2_07131 [Fusarium poae]